MSITPAAVHPASGPETATHIADDSRGLDEYSDHAKYFAVR
jgi:hypothetical protein